MIISDTKKELQFFEEVKKEYRKQPINQRAEFIKAATKAFQDKLDKIRDEVSEIERGQHFEGLHGITHGHKSLHSRKG